MLLQTVFLILPVIITAFLTVHCKMVVSPKVTVSRGEDVVLNCSFTHSKQQHYSGKIVSKWLPRKLNAEPFFTCSVKNDSMEGDSGCSFPKLKYSLNGDPRHGELHLLIRNVQLHENGVYFCQVELDSYHEKKEINLEVTGEPRILSLSVVETPSDSYNTSRRLQCEVEGHPLPKIVWLMPSRLMTESNIKTAQSGSYQMISSVPYSEDEVLTCRAENSVGEAEQTYPRGGAPLLIILTACSLTVLLLLISTGVIIYCLRKRARANDSPTHVVTQLGAGNDVKAEVAYSTMTMTDLATLQHANSTQQHDEQDVVYSLAMC